jgi:hypothetical protein
MSSFKPRLPESKPDRRKAMEAKQRFIVRSQRGSNKTERGLELLRMAQQ